MSLGAAVSVRAGTLPLPAAKGLASLPAVSEVATAYVAGFSTGDLAAAADPSLAADAMDTDQPGQNAKPGAAPGNQHTRPDASRHTAPASNAPVDANGNAIPLELRQPLRILGFMPNFRSVSGGAKPHPLGWKYNFSVATNQAMDYSSFIFLGLTSLTSEATNEHPSFGKGADGFYAYTWRGFLDKSDNTYLAAWLLPSILHEDTRFYALGAGHSIPVRALYVISTQGVARTYGGRQTPNIAGLGGKILTQVVSRSYYPPSASTFPVLATKFGYSVMRDVMFSSIREFYPDLAAHFIRRHQDKLAKKAAMADASNR